MEHEVRRRYDKPMRPLALSLLILPLCAQPPQRQLARDIFKQLIEIDTTDSIGDNTRAAEAMAARFRAAGFPERDLTGLMPSSGLCRGKGGCVGVGGDAPR
jgi:hypothetical protein